MMHTALRISSTVFACMSKACAPPPVGTGGSTPSGSSRGGSVRQLHPGSPDSMSGHNLFLTSLRMIGGPFLSPKNLTDAVHNEGNRRLAKRRSEGAIRTELMSDPKAVKQLKQLLDDTSDRSKRTLMLEMGDWLVSSPNTFGNLRGADGEVIKNPTLRDLFQRLIDTGADSDQLLMPSTKVGPSRDNLKKWWGEFTDGMDLSTPETFMASLLSRKMVQGWAESSSFTWPAVRNQNAAAKVHGVSVTGHLKSSTSGPQDTTLDSQLRQSLVRAEYAATQKYLRETLGPDVTSLRLYRGVQGQYRGSVEGDEVSVEANPLSSWSTSRPIARSFAALGSDRRNGALLFMDVPLEAIQSTPFTGRGCLGEFEVVVIGHPSTAKISMQAESD